MRERIKPTRSGLFAIELLIAVGIFSLCAAICVGLFVRAEVMSQDSANLNRAVAEARNVAECFKSAVGDIGDTARLTGGEIAAEGTLLLKYDGDWNRLGSGTTGTFELTLLPTQEDGYTGASVSVKRYDFKDGAAVEEDILCWDIAALEVES